jgi:hypothetical protein
MGVKATTLRGGLGGFAGKKHDKHEKDQFLLCNCPSAKSWQFYNMSFCSGVGKLSTFQEVFYSF